LNNIVSLAAEVNTAARKRLESWLVAVMTAATVLILILMPVHAFFATWLGTLVGPLLVWKSWKEILLLALVPIAVWFCVLRPDIAKVLWRRPVNQLGALYVLLHLVLSVSSTASAEAVLAGLRMNLRFFAIFVLVQIIAAAKPPYVERLKQLVPRWLLWTAIGLGVLAVLQVTVLPKDFLTHFGYNKDATIAPYILVDENPDALRAFATMRGPNTLGEYLLLPIATALYCLYVRRRDVLAWAALGASLVAVFLTGSRSAWLGAAVTIVACGALLLPRVHFKRWAKKAAIPAVLLVALIGWGAMNIPAIRLAVFHSSPGDSSLNEGSNDKHWQATAQGIDDVVRHPGGNGPGSAGPASFYNKGGTNLSENYFVQIAQEVGVIGLGLFVAICILAIKAIVRRRSDLLSVALIASFVGLSVVNVFLHGWADDPTALTWWALAGLFIDKA
jgi:hypothetical protein